MKKTKFIILFCSWAVLAIAGACGDGSGNNNGGNSPTQADFDALFADAFQFAQDNGGIAGQACITDCASLEADLNDPLVEGTFDCDGGGTFTLTAGNCDSNGTLQVMITLDNCVDQNGNTVDGTITANITVSASSTTLAINFNGVTAQGFSFSSSNATTTIPCQNGVTEEATCSGSISSGNTSCTLDSDCTGCTI